MDIKNRFRVLKTVLIASTLALVGASLGVAPAAHAAGGMVSVTFDDGWTSQYNNALPVLNKYGVPATMYIISGSVNDVPDYMTQAQIQAFANRGDEIASHTVTHADLTTLNSTNLNNELAQSQTALRQMFGPSAAVDFASPYGAYNATTTAAVQKYYATQRNTDEGFNPQTGFNPYNMLVQNVVSTTSAATVQGWINSAKANNTWLVLVYHEVGASIGGDIYHTDTAALDSHMAAVKNSGLPMVTVRQGVQALTSPTTTAPAAPTGVTATAGNASATVSWTAPSNGGSPITSYTVTPRTGTTNLTPVTITGNPPATSTTITGLTNGTAYTFTVTATNTVGTSPASAASNSVTPAAATTAPAAPTGVTATAGNASATVSWTAPNNGGSPITSYTVTPRTGTTNLTPVTITGNPPATSTTITGLTNGTAYTFTVTATNTVGTSPASAASNSVTPAAATTAPAAPTGVTATAGNASATVSWTAPNNGGSAITSYTVTPRTGTTNLTPVTITGNPPATSTTITGLTNGTAYTFTVTATNTVGTSPASAASNSVTPAAATTAPAAPTGVTATAGNASATVSWTAPSNGGSPITSYTVTPRTGTTNLTPVTITGNPPATSTTITGLTNGTAYTFTVTATNTVGTSPASAASNSVTPAAATTAPAAPTGVTATAGNASATVSWTAPSNGGSPITSYTVTPRTGTTNLTPVTITGNPPATSTTITGLTNGTAYTFTVTATNTVGTSPASAASNSVTPAATTTDGTITNGGFEAGLTGWTTSGVRAPVASTTARTGTGSALLGVSSGSEPLGNSVLSQTITVPATGTPTLSFWYKPHTTDEPCTGTACRYDWMEAQLRSTTGTVLQSLFKRASNSATWTRITADLSAYKGQNITLWFNVHLDGAVPADNTWMYLDDVTLTNTQTTTTAPAAPTGVTATAGNASATVSWTAPSNGGSPITSYTVTPRTGTTNLTPVTITGNPPATSTTITGLTNGTAYTFTVTATNTVGTSPASAASNSVTPAAATTDGTITNGGFEAGLTGWTTSGVRAPVASTTARTGTGSALLGVSSGSEPLGNSVLSQTITVPATGTPTLSFWYKPHTTDEPCTGTACRYDWMEAQLRSTTGTVLQSLFKRASNSATWTRITADLSAYKGQNITLWFNVHLDGAVPADNTWMYLDDVTLTNTQTTTTAPAALTALSAPEGNSAGSLQGLSRREVAPGILRN